MINNLQHVVPQSWRWERQSRVMWTGSHIRGPQASWYKDKGKERQKSKEGRQRQLQDLLTHDVHQPSAVQTSYRPVQTQTSWSSLSQCCTGITAADQTQLRSPMLKLQGPDIGTHAGETHHFFLPIRNFFFTKTIYFRGTQTSRAVEVT